MVATKSAIHGDRKKILSYSPEEKPLALQIGGSDKSELAEVSKIAEDMGLEIDVLGGNLGVHSARYAGEDCIAKNNISKVLSKLEMKKNRSANFRTVIALILDGQEHFFEGQCSGLITNSELGDKGFGYDPIFMPNGYNKTFAQMSKAEKGLISHRGKAVAKLARFLSF